MYRFGHFGVSLLVFAPIGFLLVTAGAVELAFVTGATMVWLSTLPDVDHKLPYVTHRGPTHSLLFAAFVGGVFAAVGVFLERNLGLVVTVDGVGTVGLGAFGFLLGSVTVVAHLLGDVITPMGVNFLWPLSTKRYSLSLTPAKSTVWNYGLFALGVFAVAAATVVAIRGL
ncbi:inner membrane protein [Halogranum amylolyticum]|uniref:Inner membrane protein n=1 Tax=Halogranum amylolyticum TaxID=660520 RepID=A0A1H8U5J4_9EURY|nr:metal-dependent hydrolase [Halogranum amylolyticum]SEO98347.1 inner membrane protein [Halogranum amylolyticum]